MPDLAAASAGLIAALKGNDQESIAAAIEAAASFDEKPGDDRQRLRGRSQASQSVEVLLVLHPLRARSPPI